MKEHDVCLFVKMVVSKSMQVCEDVMLCIYVLKC